MSIETLDYRNGKYQGNVDSTGRRHGLGIFIDDDLTFYASHWNNNKLHGQTLLYISHGKYIYGEWKNNSLSGLAVFRCGDTVLVGEFKDNFPVGRCMLIFERFNFVCVLEEDEGEWSMVDNGTISNHKMLQKYIEKLGIAVPDHYFSLTKFICNFTLRTNSLKTFPCYVGCCYFGFVNGLAMVFNCNNGLVAIGKHTNEEVSEFGGKWKNSRNGCEGNFEFGGERVNYSGERPGNQIYPIFQRLHKRSLNFVNEYFDSKIKTFTNVEILIRNQMKKIMEACKSKYSFSADLNDSLDYQEYTEEESFKLNQNRESLYEPVTHTPKQNTVFNTPKKNQINSTITPKEVKETVEKADENIKFFRKSAGKSMITDQSKLSTHGTKTTQPKSSSELKKQDQAPCVDRAKRSPFRDNKQERRGPSEDNISPFVIKKDLRTSFYQKETEFEPKESVKPKEKTRHNNLRYLVNHGAECPEETAAPLVKNNHIYRETPKKEESPESFKLPTFKALGEEIQNKKIAKYQIQEPLSKNSLVKQDFQNRLTSTTKKRDEISKPVKPNYEDIQERRKRILKSFQQINQKPQKESQDPSPLNQYESPFNGVVFSLPRDEAQMGPGFIPLSISNKEERVSPYKAKYEKQLETYGACEKENLNLKKPYDMPSKINLQQRGYRREIEDEIMETRYFNYKKSIPEIVRGSKAQEMPQHTPQRSETISRDSSKRQRKSYQYVYE